MIGIVLVTHGRLAKEFISALEHVIGKQEGVAAVCIGPDDDMEERRAEILQRIADVDKGKGVVLLTDMFGGTPSNLAISVMQVGQIEVVAGVNLPLLIKLGELRKSKPLQEAVAEAQEAGRKYIHVASHLMPGAQRAKA
ncbi:MULTISPECIES: PTS sugar transporter subunit IIA [Limibacillus]|jgi:PTS system mannose-specific IIA component|uniref:PTS system mannose-specific IIA component n=1 Tax=Limibacillus halophilus TaxID=1579333 RepID=A0A839SXZ7_9PROT|nr:PTS sugar transporter subunit IIA [Limibacillus halophilus]MBB3066406.1 PTS system mannose-specific IIA component [Limibacillus halophilus]